MKHVDVYKQLKQMFPMYVEYSEDWFPNGKDSIRVRTKSGSDFIFTYHDWYDWSLETVESYLRKMKGGGQMNVRLHENSNEDE